MLLTRLAWQLPLPDLMVQTLIPAISLAGLPPFSGFWPKLALFRAGLGAGQYLVIGIAILMSILTLYSMIKVWNQAFWKPAPEDTPEPIASGSNWNLQLVPVLILTVLILALGLFPNPLLRLAQDAAYQLLAPAEYIGVVLGG